MPDPEHTPHGVLNHPLLLDQRYVETALQSATSAQEFSTMLFPVREPSANLLEGVVAVISVRGSLYHRGWRSYEWIEKEFSEALENPNVKGILFDIDSPGGMVNGCFDLADFIYESRGKKPTLAIANERACSAAYAIGSSCDRFVTTRTADVGSVGVLRMHWDVSGAMERWGEKVTFIFEGAHKVDGNPYEPLPADVRNRLQREVSGTYELFVETVARNRGLTSDEVRATEALCYQGANALEIGFADAVMPARDALAEFVNQFNNPIIGGVTMKIKSSVLKANLTEQMKANGMTNEAIEESIAKLELPDGDAEIDVEEEAAKVETPGDEPITAEQERARTKAILSSDHAKGRETLAQHLAFETSSTLEEAEALLQATPVSKNDPLSSAMAMTEHPNIDDDLEGDAPTVQSTWGTAFKKSGASIKKDAA